MDYTTKHRDGRRQWNFNKLVTRDGRTFKFLDYVFDSGSLHGATGTSMVPITEAQMEERRENYRDPEHSPLRRFFDNDVSNGMTEKPWDEWIEDELTREGDRLLYDPSHEAQYGDVVREHATRELGMHDIVAVECIGGGRCFTPDTSYEVIYDQEALAAAWDAEEGTFPEP